VAWQLRIDVRSAPHDTGRKVQPPTAFDDVSRRRSELDLFNALARDGRPEDLAELSDRLRRCVHWVLHRRPWGSALIGEAEDIVGESRLRLEALRTRGFNGNDAQFKSYLYGVVVSACADAARHHKFATSLDEPVTLPDGDEKPLGDVLGDLVTADVAADQTLGREEETHMVRRALAVVDERCRRVLTRFYLEDRPIADIARLENMRQNTVEVALSRCRNRLYATVLGLHLEGTDASRRERIATIGRQLPGVLGKVFVAWWSENRSVLDISKDVGLTPGETRQLLGKAKLDVWQSLRDGAA